MVRLQHKDVEAESSAVGADVPGGGALLEQIDQCDTILGQKASWFDPNDYQRPDHEVDLSAIAAFAAQGKSS